MQYLPYGEEQTRGLTCAYRGQPGFHARSREHSKSNIRLAAGRRCGGDWDACGPLKRQGISNIEKPAGAVHRFSPQHRWRSRPVGIRGAAHRSGFSSKSGSGPVLAAGAAYAAVAMISMAVCRGGAVPAVQQRRVAAGGGRQSARVGSHHRVASQVAPLSAQHRIDNDAQTSRTAAWMPLEVARQKRARGDGWDRCRSTSPGTRCRKRDSDRSIDREKGDVYELLNAARVFDAQQASDMAGPTGPPLHSPTPCSSSGIILTRGQGASKAQARVPTRDSRDSSRGGFNASANSCQNGGGGCWHLPGAQHTTRAN